MNIQENTIITQLKQAIERTLNAYENYKKLSQQQEENKNFLFDVIISNLELINNLYRKLSQTTQNKLNIDSNLFEYYAKELMDTTKKVDDNLIFKILEKELPFLLSKIKKL